MRVLSGAVKDFGERKNDGRLGAAVATIFLIGRHFLRSAVGSREMGRLAKWKHADLLHPAEDVLVAKTTMMAYSPP